MTIDSHQHFWRYDPVRYDWISDEMRVLKRDFLPPDLQSILASNAIDGCVAVQAEQSPEETDFLSELAGRFDFIKGVVGWIDLRSPRITEQLDRYAAQKKIKGFRHILQSEPPGFMNDPRFIDGVNFLADRGYSYDLLIYHHQFDEALKFLHKTTNVKIVIDHLGKPSIRTGEKTQWELNLAAASTFENVYCKLSGMVTEANWRSWTKEDLFPFMDELFESFGPERIMYGSDWPVCLLAADYGTQLGVVTDYLGRLSKAEKASVMGRNAKTFYNLE
jgi:L-fuconolactonase